MSTHMHQLVQTTDPKGFMYCFRQSYGMYFNHKYHREGRLGEEHHFTMEVAGYHHTVAAASYTLRNAVHHGVNDVQVLPQLCGSQGQGTAGCICADVHNKQITGFLPGHTSGAA